MECVLINDDEIMEIKRHYRAIKEILISHAENTSDYREASNVFFNIEYHSLKRIINDAEKTLLIRCYTYMEQSIKKLYYQCLIGHNTELNLFIRTKLPERTFSPNVRLENLKNSLSTELNIKLPFITLNSTHARKYDVLIGARHKYSHGNNYSFTFENYKDVISFMTLLNYIVKDYKSNLIKREVFEVKLPYLIELLANMKKKEISYQRMGVKPPIKTQEREELYISIKQNSKEIMIFLRGELKAGELKNISLLKVIYKKLKKIQKYNLTNNSCESFIDSSIRVLTLN